jgi:hypothetical protein
MTTTDIKKRKRREKHKCPVCGEYEFPGANSYDICPICNWEDSEFQLRNPDDPGGPNKPCLSEYKANWESRKPKQ